MCAPQQSVSKIDLHFLHQPSRIQLIYIQQHAISPRHWRRLHLLLVNQNHNVAAEGLPANLVALTTHCAALPLGIRTLHADCARPDRPRAPEQGRTMVHYQKLQYCRR
jgi:hypothetical protein